jgi:hypothetical protein
MLTQPKNKLLIQLINSIALYDESDFELHDKPQISLEDFKKEVTVEDLRVTSN